MARHLDLRQQLYSKELLHTDGVGGTSVTLRSTRIITSNCIVSSAINDKFDEW